MHRAGDIASVRALTDDTGDEDVEEDNDEELSEETGDDVGDVEHWEAAASSGDVEL